MTPPKNVLSEPLKKFFSFATIGEHDARAHRFELTFSLPCIRSRATTSVSQSTYFSNPMHHTEYGGKIAHFTVPASSTLIELLPTQKYRYWATKYHRLHIARRRRRSSDVTTKYLMQFRFYGCGSLMGEERGVKVIIRDSAENGAFISFLALSAEIVRSSTDNYY